MPGKKKHKQSDEERLEAAQRNSRVKYGGEFSNKIKKTVEIKAGLDLIALVEIKRFFDSENMIITTRSGLVCAIVSEFAHNLRDQFPEVRCESYEEADNFAQIDMVLSNLLGKGKPRGVARRIELRKVDYQNIGTTNMTQRMKLAELNEQYQKNLSDPDFDGEANIQEALDRNETEAETFNREEQEKREKEEFESSGMPEHLFGETEK